MNEFRRKLKELVDSDPFQGKYNRLAVQSGIHRGLIKRVAIGKRAPTSQLVGRVCGVLPSEDAKKLLIAYLSDVAAETTAAYPLSQKSAPTKVTIHAECDSRSRAVIKVPNRTVSLKRAVRALMSIPPWIESSRDYDRVAKIVFAVCGHQLESGEEAKLQILAALLLAFDAGADTSKQVPREGTPEELGAIAEKLAGEPNRALVDKYTEQFMAWFYGNRPQLGRKATQWSGKLGEKARVECAIDTTGSKVVSKSPSRQKSSCRA